MHCIVGPYISTLYMMFHLNFQDNFMMTFKLTWQNRRWLQYVYV